MTQRGIAERSSESREHRISLRAIPDFDAARVDWQRLAADCGNVFLTWEWATTWWEYFGAGGELLLHAVGRQTGPSSAILPLYVAGGRIARVVRFVGHGPADELGPVCGREHRDKVTPALRELVDLQGRRGMLIAERMPDDQDWHRALGAVQLRGEEAALLQMNGLTWDGWLSKRSGHFRSRTRGAERKLRREHEVHFRLIQHLQDVEGGLRTFIDLHQLRWRGRSTAFAGRRAEFHAAFARRAAENGWLRLWIAELDGKPVAGLLNYRIGGVEWGVQSGRDPAAQRTGVAHVLFMHVVRSCFDDGLIAFRLGRGEELFKSRIRSDEVRVVTLAAGSPTLKTAAQATFALRRRVPARPREAVSRALRIT